MDEDLLLKLVPDHADVIVIGSAKCDLLSYMDMRLSENFDPFRTILSELASTANDYYKQSVAKRRAGQQFTTEDIENAFAVYITIFEAHMPLEETWDYLLTPPAM